MKLFRFLAYSLAFFIGAVFAFRGTNSFPGNPAKQYKPSYAVKTVNTVSDAKAAAPAMSNLAQQGKNLFIANCAACHNKNMKDKLIGPALGGVEARWSDYPKEDLYNWIRNSQAMVSAEHPRAVAVWEESDRLIMTSFASLSDEDIDAMLAYVNAVYQP
ncbi:c-type cytochrome [Flavilitoribacter nigricans]|uniref:Cytochrome c domain-containing protein n=1 Tax=Flavilitoribacter nigricans (strain ATCC 23147 / DSM 23189 / NBRC 102662 / NCIMB 1420 / SS-2) TaxID=1122177 RepID=A0A2D0N771_FLAN2|nr:c-type cytochrome [Flavilitoribacter nigricans]PHN04361.1 hypothetical protein CRP01_22635 [Flavilitoribacter nigricans DSM 23189 = NBRC 102662]